MAQTFSRYEKKYLLDLKQYERLMDRLKEYVVPDKFFNCQIRSIYYDTDSYQLIRRSIEKPEYKEKLRIRSYKETEDDEKVFVEFKKKLDGIVYKRRTKAICKDVIEDIYNCQFTDSQISNEIKYALNYYNNLHPAFYIGCTRTSYKAKDDDFLRITFDSDIKYRRNNLCLKADITDKSVTDKIVMEIKVGNAMPLWLCEILDEVKAYPRGFSKVGTAFEKEVKENLLCQTYSQVYLMDSLQLVHSY